MDRKLTQEEKDFISNHPNKLCWLVIEEFKEKFGWAPSRHTFYYHGARGHKPNRRERAAQGEEWILHYVKAMEDYVG